MITSHNIDNRKNKSLIFFISIRVTCTSWFTNPIFQVTARENVASCVIFMRPGLSFPKLGRTVAL